MNVDTDTLPGNRRPALFPLNGQVVVIGAGIAGAAAARTLADAGCQVRIIEKSRGPGGRMATRHGDGGDFDHGAQYFTARDPGFQAWLDSACRQGHVAQWPPIGRAVAAGGARWVGTPGMNAVARSLLGDDIELVTRTEVAQMRRRSDRWHLLDTAGREAATADAVVVSAPAPQAVALLQPLPALAHAAARASMAPCWALRVVLRRGVELPTNSGESDEGPVAWWALNSSKPGRPDGLPHLVVHAGVEFSRTWLEAGPDDVRAQLLPGVLQLLQLQQADVVSADAHRWRFARVEQPLGVDALHDREARVVAVGDWCLGPRVESAWLSGVGGARRLLGLVEASGGVPAG